MTFLIIIWLHFLGDFVFQSDKMAISKSGSIKWLSIHCATYSAVFLLLGWKFALANFALHWITDFISSKLTSHYYKKGDRHMFFLIIGADQSIHFSCLLITNWYLL